MTNTTGITKVTEQEADQIIETRKPLGQFWLKDGKIYIGIDNSTGDAWVEEFKTKNACFKWLTDTEVPATVCKRLS